MTKPWPPPLSCCTGMMTGWTGVPLALLLLSKECSRRGQRHASSACACLVAAHRVPASGLWYLFVPEPGAVTPRGHLTQTQTQRAHVPLSPSVCVCVWQRGDWRTGNWRFSQSDSAQPPPGQDCHLVFARGGQERSGCPRAWPESLAQGLLGRSPPKSPQ